MTTPTPSKLPGCMMPDGADPCAEYQALYRDLAAREAELVAMKQRAEAAEAAAISATSSVGLWKERAEEAIKQCRVLYNETIQRAVTAERKAEEAARDVARYRWLVNTDQWNYTPPPLRAVRASWLCRLMKDELDAAIDAAMKGGK